MPDAAAGVTGGADVTGMPQGSRAARESHRRRGSGPPGDVVVPPGGEAAGVVGRPPAGEAGGVVVPLRESAGMLAIAGLVPLSTVDWPGRLVATAFLQGCPWRCTYCHNASILDLRTPGVVPWSSVRELLGRRHGLLDGVVFSGGEPTRQPGLVDAARQVHDEGFLVGLHTGGAYPARLAALLPHVDWIGFDVKAPAHLYRAITRVGGPTTTADRAFASLQLVLDAGVDVTVRTTVDPTVLSDDDVRELTDTLFDLGVKEHVLQQVRTEGTTPEYRAALALVPD